MVSFLNTIRLIIWGIVIFRKVLKYQNIILGMNKKYVFVMLVCCTIILAFGAFSLLSSGENLDPTEDSSDNTTNFSENHLNNSVERVLSMNPQTSRTYYNTSIVETPNSCITNNFNFTTSISISEIKEDEIIVDYSYEFENEVESLTKDTGIFSGQQIVENYYGASDTNSSTFSLAHSTEYSTEQEYRNNYTILSPDFEIEIVGNGSEEAVHNHINPVQNTSSEVIHNQELFNCVTEFSVSDSNISTVENVVLGENMIYLEYDTDLETSVYSVEVESRNSDTLVIGSLTNQSLDRNAQIISYLESENITTDKNRYVEQYVLESSDSRPPGVAYDITDPTKKIIIDQYRLGTEYSTTGHEWIHTVQTFQHSQNSEWFIEGSAEYLGAVLEYNVGSTEEEQVQNAFSFGWESSVENVTLSNSSSWKNNAEYNRGSNVTYIVDTVIREETNGNKDITDLIRILNQKDSRIEHKHISNLVGQMTTERFQERFNKYVNSSSPVLVNEELESMGYQTDISLPEIFSSADYEVVRCEYDQSIMSVDACSENR
jgi:hypothetical protein